MRQPENPTGVVSGSFKFKPDIDLAIEEFKDNGVTILAPARGPLLLLPDNPNFHPLKHEYHLPLKLIEDDFLRCIKEADFLYIVDVTGYVGLMVSGEMGAAIASRKPIYLKEPVSRLLDFEGECAEIVWDILKVKTPTEVAQMAVNRAFDTEGYYWCHEDDWGSENEIRIPLGNGLAISYELKEPRKLFDYAYVHELTNIRLQ